MITRRAKRAQRIGPVARKLLRELAKGRRDIEDGADGAGQSQSEAEAHQAATG